MGHFRPSGQETSEWTRRGLSPPPAAEARRSARPFLTMKRRPQPAAEARPTQHPKRQEPPPAAEAR
eukprot:1687261-Alexandrium_andersonii.AAC.1